jgi:hypothetical protein
MIHRACSRVAFAALGATALLTVGCDKVLPTATVVLVDLSGSVPSSTVDFYADAIAKHVLLELTAVDQLTVLPVDDKAEPRTENIFSANPAAQNFSSPSDGVARRDQRRHEKLMAFLKEGEPKLKESIRIAATARASFRSGTDLVGGLHAAAARFPNGGEGRRVLVIFSDMIQESAELNIRSLARTGENGIVPMLETIASAKRFPALTGVTVVVVGAGETGANQGDDAAFFRTVRSFWKQFFDRSGATIDAERNYGYRTQDGIPALLHPVSRR